MKKNISLYSIGSNLFLFTLIFVIFIFFLNDFLNFNFLLDSYLLISILAVINLVYLTKSKARNVILGFLLISFLYGFYFIFYGLSLNDEAFSIVLTKFLPANSMIQASKLSFVLMHFLLSIFDKPYFLWERLINVIYYVTIIYLSFIFLKELDFINNNSTKYYLILLVSFSLAYNWYKFILPYNKFFILFSLIFVVLWYKTIKDNNVIFSFLSGISFLFIIYTRITFIILAFYVLFSILYNRVNLKAILAFVLGILFSLIFLFILNFDIASVYKTFLLEIGKIKTVCLINEPSHNLFFLIKKYLIDFLKSSLFAVILIVYDIGAKFLNKNFKVRIFIKYNDLFKFLLLVIISLVSAKYYDFSHTNVWFYITFGVIIYLALKLIPALSHFDKYDIDLLVFLAFFSIFSFFGSAVGITKIYHTGAIIFILPVLIYLNEKYLNLLYKYLLLFLLIVGVYVNVTFYWNETRPFDFSASFKTGVLKGIHTAKFKVKSIEDFERKLNNMELSDDVLAVNRTFYFLLSLPQSENVEVCWWIDVNSLENEVKRGHKPKYIIYTPRSLNGKWPFISIKTVLFPWEFESYVKLDDIIKKYYQKVLASDDNVFFLYKIKNKPSTKSLP